MHEAYANQDGTSDDGNVGTLYNIQFPRYTAKKKIMKTRKEAGNYCTFNRHILFIIQQTLYARLAGRLEASSDSNLLRN